MRYILVSLLIAMLFGLVVHGIFGPEQIQQMVWVDYGFWSLILGGMGAAAHEWFKELLGLTPDTSD